MKGELVILQRIIDRRVSILFVLGSLSETQSSASNFNIGFIKE